MIRRWIHPVFGRAVLIAALIAPIALPAGAVVCMDAHGRIAIEFANASTGRCAGHGHDHCHTPVAATVEHDSCCDPAPQPEVPTLVQHGDHGCVDLLVPDELVRIDHSAAIDVPVPHAVVEFVLPSPPIFDAVDSLSVGHSPPWVRPALQTFIILT